MPPSEAAGQADSADRRVHLANERTYLAWVRTAIGTFGLALAVGRIIPDFGHARTRWTYRLVGSGWAVLGLMWAFYGLHRHRAVEAAIRRGGSVVPRDRVLVLLTGYLAAVGVATFVVLTMK